MAIPEGYRLLTAEDIGKVFGVDLERVVYCDTSVTPISASGFDPVHLTNFAEQTNTMGEVEVCYIAKNGVMDGYQTSMYEFGTWKNESIEMNNNISVTSYHTDVEWNNWLYVKDIETTDPYNIKIKNKEGIKLLTKDKDIHFDDDVKITIDESLLGGGGSEETGYTLTLKQYSDESKYKYYPFGDTSGGFQYRINGGEWQTFANAPITIENVRTIQFFAHATAEYGCSLVVKQNNNVNSIYDTEIYCNYDYTDEPNNEQSFCMCLIEDTTLYIGGTRVSMSGGGAN